MTRNVYRYTARATYSKMVGRDAVAKNRLISQINVTTNEREPSFTWERSHAPIISFPYLPQMHRTYQLAARCTTYPPRICAHADFVHVIPFPRIYRGTLSETIGPRRK